MVVSTKIIGNYGEDLACEYLKKQGYQILERNYRIRGGEIDIVARDGEYLDFVGIDYADDSQKPRIELIKNITS